MTPTTFDPASLLIAPTHADAADARRLVSFDAVDAPKDSALAAVLAANPELGPRTGALVVDDKLALVDANPSLWSLARVAQALPPGTYVPGWPMGNTDGGARHLAAWALAQYQYRAYHGSAVAPQDKRALVVEDAGALAQAQALVRATWLVRDLVNTPANLLGPAELVQAALALAKTHGARAQVVDGTALAQGFPAIQAVGQAASDTRRPALIDFHWGDSGPRITLVGKGVCYDTGGLNLKPGNFMRNMKKDMGGAAHVLGLASLIMDLGLRVQLRVIIGAVENSVAADSFRPGDVIKTKKGLSVEIGNTDAEGRLVLADCMTLAQNGDAPDLMIDFATLTGAARVALGTDLPAVFSNDQALADALVAHGQTHEDFLWSLPLYRPYAKRLESTVADLCNIAEGERYGDAIMAALFLDRFVEPTTPWLHLDCFAWNTSTRPGRPKGGEAQGLWACLALVQARAAQPAA